MGDEAKNIAVLVRDRQDEALRMSLGLLLADDKVTVFNIGGKTIERNDANIQNVESLDMMEAKLYSTQEHDEGFEFINMALIPEKLTGYDVIIPY